MFEHDRSAARGLMATRVLTFLSMQQHLHALRINCCLIWSKLVRKDTSKPARSFSDYALEFDLSKVPAGVTAGNKNITAHKTL